MLAAQLGMPVGELTERMTLAEETHWMAFYQISPFGEERGDLRSALVAQLIYNTHARKPKKLEDFMLFKEKPNVPGDSPKTIRKNFDRLIARQKAKARG